ncbi:nucleotide-binding alpha-beta plait domain-containing protein, partial [Tanacetum coccineum]
EVKDAEPVKQEELSPNDENDDIGVSQEDDKDVAEGEDRVKDVEDGGDVQPSVENVAGDATQGSSDVVESIHGKRCWTAPSEDNDTLFLGNICNTWTTEAIRQKLKDYDIEGVERITLVAHPQHEGLSRGFAFIEFSGHPDAQLAYKRLQKPDAIFGILIEPPK